jgi:hypothetical protein
MMGKPARLLMEGGSGTQRGRIPISWRLSGEEPRHVSPPLQEVSMSKTILALSTAVLICASSQFASADESGAITGGVGGAVAGAVVGGPVGAVVGGVGGAAIGNSVTNHRHYHRGYAYHPYHHHYDQYWKIDDVRCEGVVGVRGLHGEADKAVGKVQNAVGGLSDALRDAAKK